MKPICDVIILHELKYKYELSCNSVGIVGHSICPICGDTIGLCPEPNSYFNGFCTLKEQSRQHLYRIHIDQPQPTVSSFANFVYQYQFPRNAYQQTHCYQEELKACGANLHKLVEQTKRWIAEAPWAQDCGNFAPIYIDEPNTESLFLSAATLHERPIVGKPDLVLHDSQNESTVVVERKFTSYEPDRIPDVGWLNNRMQLWLYMWLTPWANHGSVRGILEYWSMPSVAHDPVILKRTIVHQQDTMGPQWLRKFGAEWTGPSV